MHDPMTVAFEIKSPFIKRRYKGFNSRTTLVTIWHLDPEKHGDDDSCGWAYVNLSEADVAWAEARAKEEWRFWFSPDYGSINFSDAGNLEILGTVWKEARFRAGGRARHKPLTAWDMAQIFDLMGCPGDNFGSAVRRARRGTEGLAELFSLTLRLYLTRKRPWWRRPRWHVHHWRVQFDQVQKFKRWAFSRCTHCGNRFKWGEAPVTDSWHSDGPRWFRSETGKYHMACYKRLIPVGVPVEP